MRCCISRIATVDRMTIPFSTWRPLVPAEITDAPETPGVFEIATLVRTLLHVGAASESLAQTLTRYIETPGHVQSYTGGLYFRYASSQDPEPLQTTLLDAYRERHGGFLPPAQEVSDLPRRPLRHLKAV
jgi:hypothetical protein